MTNEGKTNSLKPVIIWLITGCVLIAAMVVIGGITRLTHSGLSMTEWNPVTGIFPPATEEAWQEEFNKYKQIPEYELKHSWMELEDFKFIYFWEFLHRQWGRMLGVVFIVPFLFFVWRGYIRGALLRRNLLVMLWGGGVGALGWFMVKSGLTDLPDVSHYRLAVHLTAAFGLFLFIWWTALNLMYSAKKSVSPHNKSVYRFIIALLVVAFIQVIYGAFTAGLRAGYVHTTFPLMTGNFIPHDFLAVTGTAVDLLEHKSSVQFMHRIFAFLLVILTGVLVWKLRKKTIPSTVRSGIKAVTVTLIVQFLLGVFTILYSVPPALGVLHQIGALAFLAALVYLMHRVKAMK